MAKAACRCDLTLSRRCRSLSVISVKGDAAPRRPVEPARQKVGYFYRGRKFRSSVKDKKQPNIYRHSWLDGWLDPGSFEAVGTILFRGLTVRSLTCGSGKERLSYCANP
jgi:hypothetical protein